VRGQGAPELRDDFVYGLLARPAAEPQMQTDKRELAGAPLKEPATEAIRNVGFLGSFEGCRFSETRSWMELLPGERKLSESSDGTVLLTSHRVRLDQGGEFVSISLDQVASCSIGTRSHPILLVIAAIVWLGSFQFAGDQVGTIPFVVGALAGALIVALYVMSRTQVIVIASRGESIRIRTRGMTRAVCIQFIDDLERAKVARTAVPMR
jgi:hypothetical protein